MRIAVAGGTGLMGRLVAAEATRRGHEPAVLARSAGVDLVSGSGAAEALDGVDVVIDTLNTGAMAEAASVAFFERTSRTLLAAEAAAGVGHHLALSIVGVDRAPHGYYAGKRAQELVVEAGAVPWTVLRATQFHEFAAQIFESGRRGPLRFAPRMRTQPVAAAEVASRLVTLAEAPPSGWARELAGPAEESLVEMVRAWARATGRRGPLIPISLGGGFGAAQRDGRMLPSPDAELGRQTFAEWLAGAAH